MRCQARVSHGASCTTHENESGANELAEHREIIARFYRAHHALIIPGAFPVWKSQITKDFWAVGGLPTHAIANLRCSLLRCRDHELTSWLELSILVNPQLADPASTPADPRTNRKRLFDGSINREFVDQSLCHVCRSSTVSMSFGEPEQGTPVTRSGC